MAHIGAGRAYDVGLAIILLICSSMSPSGSTFPPFCLVGLPVDEPLRMPLTDITVVGAGGSKARKSTSRARNKQRVGKENVPSSKSGDGTKQTKQTRQRRPKATGTEEIVLKRTINSIAESVMKEREEKGVM